MELTELQKHDESKVTVFIFHSLAFLKFVWCNLNNKIFLKCFSFHGCKFSLTSLYVFVNWSSILTFQYCLFDQLSDEAGEERSADNIILIQSRPRLVLSHYTKLYSFRLSCNIVSFTAANTNRMFSVSETAMRNYFTAAQTK